MSRFLSLFPSSTLKLAYQRAWVREFRSAIHDV